jgi:hypothetical protein
MKKNYTIPRAARVYDVSEDRLQAAIDSGELQLHPLRIWRLFDVEVETWIAKTRADESEPRQ